MVSNNHIKNKFSQTWYINSHLNRLLVGHVCESIDNDKDQIIDLIFLVNKD